MCNELDRRQEMFEAAYKDLMYKTSNLYYCNDDENQRAIRIREFEEAVEQFKEIERNLEDAKLRLENEQKEERIKERNKKEEIEALKHLSHLY